MATCADIEELRDLYVLGGLPSDVAEDVEAHLEGCESCREKVAASWSAAQLMRLAVPQVNPPAQLGLRVLATASAERIESAEGRRPHPNPLAEGEGASAFPSPTRGFEGGIVRLHERRPFGLLGSGQGSRWPWVASLAAVLPLALSGWLAFQVSSLRQQMDASERSLQQQVEAGERVLRRTGDTAYAAIDMLGEGIARGAAMARVDGTEMAPSATGMLYYGWRTQEGVLVVSGLPPLDQDHVYQLWLVSGNTRMSGGTLYLKEDGRGMLVVKSPMPLTSVDAVGITNEPRGGSEQRTGQQYMWGRLRPS
jgi:anti-sigma factor RsiW